MRVAQVWASQNWGAIFTPRIGMEVVVDFLEGDPDQPIVIGCVYNGDNKPPYKLPDKKNISGWKSNSTTGGGGYNEFVMDDTAGSELVRFHAQKDLDSTIENDETREVKNDRTTKIVHDDKLDVGNELFIEAGTKITIKVGQSSIVMDAMSITIDFADGRHQGQDVLHVEVRSAVPARGRRDVHHQGRDRADQLMPEPIPQPRGQRRAS